jgi:Rps23 Pro-64 3,4-dihydroxylase Tpa1-like proline 4-hydroxylase
MYINPNLPNSPSHYREIFQNNKPFKYVVIEDFLSNDLAQILLNDFPSFDPKKALNEIGQVGRKAVHENLSEISDSYQQLANYLNSLEFLKTISQLTGIEGLINDETFYGGGTHENLHGQELDPHVDFNMDERKWYYRRLNLIIFLNQEWAEDWGGLLELHSNPRQPEENQIVAFAPTFNRCVIFETHEYSWHGFSLIQLPTEKQHLSRKSLSIYLYTKERPQAEKGAPHTTFYIPRPLPDLIQPGKVLTAEDYQHIKILMKRRDDLIHFYQNRELQESSDLASLKSRIKRYIASRYTWSEKYLQMFLSWQQKMRSLL